MNVRLSYIKNHHFTAKARSFKDIHIDEPESFHGDDNGPSPIEYLLIGIGGCISSSFVYCLQKNGIEIRELDVVVDGRLKHVGPEMNLKLVGIDLEMHCLFNNGQSKEKIDSCEKLFKKYCPASDLVSNGVPLKVNIIKKEV